MIWFIFLTLVKFFLTLTLVAIGERQLHYYILHGRLFKGWPSRWHDEEHHGWKMNKWWHINLSPLDYFLAYPFLAFAAWRYFQWEQIEGLAGLIGGISGCLVHMVLWNSMHRAIHDLEPNNWASKLPWFETVKENHLRHHQNSSVGLSVVFPFLDQWFGTAGPNSR